MEGRNGPAIYLQRVTKRAVRGALKNFEMLETDVSKETANRCSRVI